MLHQLNGFRVGDYVEWFYYIMRLNQLKSPSVHDDIVDVELHRGVILELHTGGEFGIPHAFVKEGACIKSINLYELKRI